MPPGPGERYRWLVERVRTLAGDRQVRIVVATKYASDEQVAEVLRAGARELGENYPERARERFARLSAQGFSFTRHLIGPLQSKKVRLIWGSVDLLQTLEREKTLRLIEKTRPAGAAPLDVLVEVNIAREPTKHGVMPEECLAFCRLVAESEAVRLRGLMAIPPRPERPADSRPWFEAMVELYGQARKGYLSPDNPVDLLSMGMSLDFEEAIRVGANMVRIGSLLFSSPAPENLSERGAGQ